MNLTTKEFIAEIFYSGPHGFRGDMQVAEKISFLVNEGYLVMRKVTIGTKSDYMNVASDTSLINSRNEAAGGSREHIALKLLAQLYCEREYTSVCVFEQSFAGFFPDIISIDKHTLCECGHTNNAEKILTYFRHPTVQRVIQVPYPDETDDLLYGYIFKAESTLVPFLDFEAKDIALSIKAILNRKRQ